MLDKVLKVLGVKSANDRVLASYGKIVKEIAKHEFKLKVLTDDELRQQTSILQARAKAGETMDALLPEAFALVREASKRTLGMRHFDTQMLGGIALNKGSIAEMKTGEGKTLVATLALFLNALSGRGAHLITVNDYLAARDSAWMGQIFQFLGLTVGCVTPGMEDPLRREAYACDITYVTNSDVGFDYLRDNMKFLATERVQRPFHFAIVDEADNILIDEARTPLIISGPADTPSEFYVTIDKVVRKLGDSDVIRDEKKRSIQLTEAGVLKVESLLKMAGILQEGEQLFHEAKAAIVHHIQQALQAQQMYSKDVNYVVREGEVMLVDEFTGRVMEGRRLSQGLHQAIEAKEGVEIKAENKTVASITYQNLFRLYPKLAGMTGTASTEAIEIQEIYNLGVLTIPPNLPVARRDHHDKVYSSSADKYEAIITKVAEAHAKGQPVLIGTTSIEKSEFLSVLLTQKNLPHFVLNAKFHAHEAEIIADAGRSKAITIATNMAGRGTDIQLGGNVHDRIHKECSDLDPATADYAARVEEITQEVVSDRDRVKQAGGLLVVGTERHENRRIDHQLRGRAGRQGDPGESVFFLSLEDDLLRVFGTERFKSFLARFGFKKGESLSHPWISSAIVKAQKRIENFHFDQRKSILKFDEVVNEQRKTIYKMRNDLMNDKIDFGAFLKETQVEIIEEMLRETVPEKSLPHEWKLEVLQQNLLKLFAIQFNLMPFLKEANLTDQMIFKFIMDSLHQIYQKRFEALTPQQTRELLRFMALYSLDAGWKEHLSQLDYLRSTSDLRAFAQKDPLNEYKREAFSLFQGLLQKFREGFLLWVFLADLPKMLASLKLEETLHDHELP